MSRLSFRPRPLDIHKKIPIVKSIKEFEDDDTPTGTRNSQILRISADAEDEVHHARTKRTVSEIPIPEFVIVDTYERDYLRIFAQPNSYIHARGVRSEIGEFVEYDLDNEDEDWLARFNEDNMMLAPEKLEYILFKLEVLDLKARERAGVMAPTFGSPVPVILQFHIAAEALQAISVKYSILESAYDYWKGKRERWQKPILRRLQPPPPVNDTNPYNVFRPREKAHRLHTRRMQRRENNVQSFEKLRQVRRSLDQAKTILEALIKREEKKREFMETEVCIQRVQIKYKDETELLEDSYLLPSFSSFSQKFGSSEDEFMDSEDIGNNTTLPSRHGSSNQYFADTKPVIVSAPNMRWRSAQSWLNRLDPMEPIMPFTKPLIPEKLAAAGIVPPRVEDCTPRDEEDNDNNAPSFRSSHGFRGRIGRGGRIIFDRWNPLSHTPVNCGDSMYISSRNRPSSQFM